MPTCHQAKTSVQNLLHLRGKIAALLVLRRRHKKTTLPAALIGPKPSKHILFLCIVIRGKMRPFVLNNANEAIFQLCDEIRVKIVRMRWQPKRKRGKGRHENIDRARHILRAKPCKLRNIIDAHIVSKGRRQRLTVRDVLCRSSLSLQAGVPQQIASDKSPNYSIRCPSFTIFL